MKKLTLYTKLKTVFSFRADILIIGIIIFISILLSFSLRVYHTMSDESRIEIEKKSVKQNFEI
jgi:hypothetical protein